MIDQLINNQPEDNIDKDIANMKRILKAQSLSKAPKYQQMIRESAEKQTEIHDDLELSSSLNNIEGLLENKYGGIYQIH